ncbi:hypothetical protein [Aquimarina brevivitae]|uniref:Uncharacterized protein n=1 Tax=Aquimarina brevivitae TaxID=323412 RepID=A0A4Q7P0D0_9FLAO|nr:hypothetical protein [Aquimarina brevivitae]RZS93246.1 hypothetical protein EV197_1822 [Aquimarina brevivitae]
MIFGNSTKSQIGELAKSVLNEHWKSLKTTKEEKSIGILDSEKIIFEFLAQNEYGCAFDHLIYVISETEIILTTDQKNKINHLHKKLNR